MLKLLLSASLLACLVSILNLDRKTETEATKEATHLAENSAPILSKKAEGIALPYASSATTK